MITLDGVVLSPSMQWTERFASTGVAQSVRTTLGGKTVVHAAPLSGGQNITLVAGEDTGWLTKTMVDALLLLSQTPGQVMALTFHNELQQVAVVFRHHEAPAVDFSPLTPKSAAGASDYFIGTLKLMRV